jgi:pyruvate kinase
MDYGIVATLGPASASEPTWTAMLDAGATAFRLNTSHIAPRNLARWIARLGAFLDGRRPAVPIVLDLQGSKWRLGRLPPRVCAEGERVHLRLAASSRSPGPLPVPHPDFFRAALESDGEIVVDDARVRLRPVARSPREVTARVVRGGMLLPRKGITLVGSAYRHESLCDADREVVSRYGRRGGIRYALSYVKDAEEMARYRRLLPKGACLIAKVERAEAVREAGGIAGSADELWLCRGDLGAELGLVGMARAARLFTSRAARLGVPALLAGQVFEHMVGCPIPTRAEVCACYDALRKGFRGVVLSDETAVGRYPAEACRAAAMFRSGGWRREGDGFSAGGRESRGPRRSERP